MIKGFYSPIHAKELALAVKRLIELKEEGIVNIAGERVSRIEFALNIAEYFRLDKNLSKRHIHGEHAKNSSNIIMSPIIK